MKDTFVALWPAILLRGIASVIFGILAFVYPGVTLAVLVTIFGAYALVDGVFTLWGAFRGDKTARTVPSVLQGVVGILVGVFCLAVPALAVLYVVVLIGVWNIAIGLLQVVGAVSLRGQIDNTWAMVAGGILAIILGALIIFYPTAGALSVVWVIAATSVIVGAVLIHFALSLRRVAKSAV
jgi:uncharacterized membrane protein HdeD (DUF308 family)